MHLLANMEEGMHSFEKVLVSKPANVVLNKEVTLVMHERG